MKRFFTMAVMSLAVLAVSCNKEDQSQETPKEEIAPKEEEVSIEGVWVLEGVIEKGKTQIIPASECDKKGSLIISKDTIENINYGEDINGKCETAIQITFNYTISGDKITTKQKGEKDIVNTFSVDKTTLKIIGDETLIFKRKN